MVLGASINTSKYPNITIRRLREKNIEVVALGLKKGKVIEVEKIDFKNIDTVTLYLNPKRQKEYYKYVISLRPTRVIFNPGTENAEFVDLLQKNNIKTEAACTQVLLSLNQY